MPPKFESKFPDSPTPAPVTPKWHTKFAIMPNSTDFSSLTQWSQGSECHGPAPTYLCLHTLPFLTAVPRRVLSNLTLTTLLPPVTRGRGSGRGWSSQGPFLPLRPFGQMLAYPRIPAMLLSSRTWFTNCSLSPLPGGKIQHLTGPTSQTRNSGFRGLA